MSDQKHQTLGQESSGSNDSQRTGQGTQGSNIAHASGNSTAHVDNSQATFDQRNQSVAGSQYNTAGDQYTIVIPGTESSLRTPDELISAMHNALQLAQYDEVLKCGAELLEQYPDSSEALLLCAVALLRGESTERCTAHRMSQIERYLKRLSEAPTQSATAWAVLGVVRYDYYTKQHRPTPRWFPSFSIITQGLKEAGPEAVNLDILDYLRATQSAYEKLELEV